VLHYEGKDEAMSSALRTEKEYGGAEFIVDFRFPAKESKPCAFIVRDGADGHVSVTIGPDGKIDVHGKLLLKGEAGEENGTGTFTALKPVGQWNRVQVTLAGATFKVMVNGKVVKEPKKTASPPTGAFALQPGGKMDFANLFVRELK
jgi:hypothetical protein